MRTGIGLPSTVPGVERAQLLDWARAAEARGFTSLGTISADPAQVDLLAGAAGM